MSQIAIMFLLASLFGFPNGSVGPATCKDQLLRNPRLVPPPAPALMLNSTLNAIAGSSATDIWAVGQSEFLDEGAAPIIEHWNGSSWSIYPAPRVSAIRVILGSLTVASPTDAWGLGVYGSNLRAAGTPLLIHWDGHAWSQMPYNSYDGLESISEAPGVPNSVWAVGSRMHQCHNCYYANPVSEHWNGTRWHAVAVPHSRESAALDSVVTLPGGTAWAVGNESNIIGDGNHVLVEHWINGSWTEMRGPQSRKAYFAVTGLSDNDVWIGGNSGKYPVVEHWNGSSWTEFSLPHGPQGGLVAAISEVSPQDVWAAGGGYLAHYDGTTWKAGINTSFGHDPANIIGLYANSLGAWTAGYLSDGFNPPNFSLFTAFAHC